MFFYTLNLGYPPTIRVLQYILEFRLFSTPPSHGCGKPSVVLAVRGHDIQRRVSPVTVPQSGARGSKVVVGITGRMVGRRNEPSLGGRAHTLFFSTVATEPKCRCVHFPQ